MKKKIILFIATLLILITNCVPVFAADSAWVLDESGVLSQETIDYVNNLNEEVFPNYENKPQLGIIIIDSLPYGYTMDEYKLEQFNYYGVGTKEENCGLLFVMAISDHKYGLEIGDGYTKGSLLRKDLETDFITDDMKQLMREENYDQAVFEIVQHLENIMLDEENGVYLAREEEKAIKDAENAEANRKSAIVIVVTVLSIIILYILYGIVREIVCVKKVNNIFNSYEHLLKYTKSPVKDLKKYARNRVSGSGIFEDITERTLKSIYEQYIADMENVLENSSLSYDIHYYEKKLKQINTYSNFVNADIMDIDSLIYEVNSEQYKKETIYKANENKIHNYIETHKHKIDEDRVSINKLEKRILKHCEDFVEMSDEVVENYFEEELKKLEFKHEYKLFLDACKDDINSKFFDEDDFWNELQKSKEYYNYSGGRIRDYGWMMLLMTQHINKNRKHYEKKQREAEARRRREEASRSSSSSFGSSFGGGCSHGGGFSGGW